MRCHKNVAIAAQTQESAITNLLILLSDAEASAQYSFVHMSYEVFHGMAANA